jgi:hypothetical protein
VRVVAQTTQNAAKEIRTGDIHGADRCTGWQPTRDGVAILRYSSTTSSTTRR